MCSRVPQANSLPEKLRFLRPLLGSWKGEGEGHYPTINSFKYREVTTFSNNGKPFLSYVQKTTSLEQEPMHTESGYLRVRQEDDKPILEFVVSDPTGVASVFDGHVMEDSNTRLVLKFASQQISCTPSAKKVSNQEREFIFFKENHSFQYTVKGMAAQDQPLTNHLSATLQALPPVSLSPEEVEYLENPVLVDIRESEEYEKGHLDQAMSCPMGKILSQSKKPDTPIHAMMQKDDHPILVFCASGLRARITADEFRDRGLNHVYALNCSWEKLQ